MTPDPDHCDLLLHRADLVATVDGARTELRGGWVAVTGGAAEIPPRAGDSVDVSGCLVTPGLVNTHHHLYQNLTRAYPGMTDKPLFGWLTSLYPLWRGLDEESVYASTFVGLAELALSGCTTSTDHLYVHPRGAGDLLGASIVAARDLGMRFHPTRGSMSLSVKDGGLPPDDVVADDDEILAASEEAVSRHHDRSPGAMVRVALAPCSPFSVTERLMTATAELAERLDVRLHTRAHRLGHLPHLGRALRPARRRRAAPSRRSRGVGRPLPEQQPHPRLRDRTGRSHAAVRNLRGPRSRRLVVGRQRLDVARGPSGDAPRQAPGRPRVADRPRRA